jgi:ABC-2 type transport system ATP-binding protein
MNALRTPIDPTGPAVVVADRLTRRFGDLSAVDQVSFAADRGELFGLVGPDGSGKTTLLRLLAGVLRPSSGDALLDGVSVAREPERVKHHIAYMSQRFGLYADLTVRENIEFYADLYRVGRRERLERLERLFHFSGLAPFQNRLAGQLSGGMKQKLGLSCALIHRPGILLLDEPTFGVDPISRRDLWLIVHEMTAQGVTVVVSTSYLDEAERFDRLLFLHRGRVVALDEPEALRRSAREELLAVRLDRPQAARSVAARLAVVRRAAVFGEWLHLTVRSAQIDGPTVDAALSASGFRVFETTRVAPSLEDVFMERMARVEET